MTTLKQSLAQFTYGAGKSGGFCSLPALEKAGFGKISRLPVSLRIVLESLARNCDGKRVREEDVRALAGWRPQAARTEEIPFVVARVVLQDFTGVPLIVDLAAMRSAVQALGRNPSAIEPLVPVDLVVDHSVQVDHARSPQALQLNMGLEFERNGPRYQFLKWGMQAFDTLSITPPGIGIVHQVNLEKLASGVLHKDGLFFPDTLVGTDSHTTMINGVGIAGWGVGGIEAEAAMLGQPVYFLTPDVMGVHLTGALQPGVTATDLVLTLTELLRKAKVVGKFVEFFGEGTASLPVPHRATIANMAPEYGATMGFFPVDEKTCQYLLATGRSEEQVELVRQYYTSQGLFGVPAAGQCDYTQTLSLDLGSVVPSVAGPKRPQDRIELRQLKGRFEELFSKKDAAGYGKPASELGRSFEEGGVKVRHGDVLIAAITSCTNTSNPSVMLAAGLVARKARAKGLAAPPQVKTSLAPGSRVVTTYLEKAGLLEDLAAVGFELVGYGCTTCIGNSGPLDASLEGVVTKHDVITASVLSGNRNFEARVHPSIKANFLMSPPLVVAFALAGRVDLDLDKEPLGLGKDGRPVFLRDLWPTPEEVERLLPAALDAADYRDNYSGDLARKSEEWSRIRAPGGKVYAWDEASTYVRHAPWFEGFGPGAGKPADLIGARALALFGDSVTTDHISPAGSIKASSPAGLYLQAQGVARSDFNSYGARRGNHEVMVRGTFANVRTKNLMVPGVEGGVTALQPEGSQLSIYDAAVEYQQRKTPLFVFAGSEYGTGSSRDWAAKGTKLLGVKAVIAKSFERIHRSNLVGMGVLPCQFEEGTDAATLGLDGSEEFSLTGLAGGLSPRMKATLTIRRKGGAEERVPVVVRIDTPIEVDYYLHGGILPFVLRQILGMA
jgi:aconitate hydratase